MNIASDRRFNLRSFLATRRSLALLVLIVGFFIVFSLLFPSTFGTYDNFSLILLNMSAEAPVLMAMAIILISGEIDLSLGAQMVLGGILCGRFMNVSGFSPLLSIIIVLLISLLTGFINGVIISKLKVTAFITTLSTGMIFLGIAVMLAGTGWTNFPLDFTAMGQAKLLGIQMPVFYMLIVVFIMSFLMAKSRFFRQYYYIGGNTKAANLSGIDIDKMKIISFVIAGFLATLAGIITAARYNVTLPNIGTGVELRAVTAAVIGGVSFTGGKGNVQDAALGAVFISCLNNVLAVLKVNQNYQFCITGIVLILAIVLDIKITKKAE